MPLFPDVDLSHIYVEPQVVGELEPSPVPAAGGETGAVQRDPELTSGVVPGLNQSLLDALQNYRPGDVGIDELDQRVSLTFPVTDWATYPIYYQATLSVAGGLGTSHTVYTVPTDRMYYLESFQVTRVTGDNTVQYMMVRHADGYWEGLQSEEVLIQYSSPLAVSNWPDPSFSQSGIITNVPGPKMLEPGSNIAWRSSGAGVSTGNWTIRLAFRVSKLIRQQTP
jgi:hypothetical protein